MAARKGNGVPGQMRALRTGAVKVGGRLNMLTTDQGKRVAKVMTQRASSRGGRVRGNNLSGAKQLGSKRGVGMRSGTMRASSAKSARAGGGKG